MDAEKSLTEFYVKFRNHQLQINKLSYNNGAVALELVDTEDGEPYMVATVNIPGVLTEEGIYDGYTFIKNWSENEGILECLIENKIVEPTGEIYTVGFSFAHLVKILI